MHTQSWILFFSPIININLSFHPDIWTSITKGLSEWPSKERGSVLFNKDKMFQWKEFGLYFSFQFVDRQYWQDKLSESLSREANPNCVNWVKINKWEDISKERNMKQRLFYLGKNTMILLFTLFWAQLSPILCKPWEVTSSPCYSTWSFMIIHNYIFINLEFILMQDEDEFIDEFWNIGNCQPSKLVLPLFIEHLYLFFHFSSIYHTYPSIFLKSLLNFYNIILVLCSDFLARRHVGS